MKYIELVKGLFTADHEARAKQEEPYVAYSIEADRLMFSIVSEENQSGYQMIDLGLPSGLKWADRNIGATSPEDAGLYFQWGDTVGYSSDQVGVDKVFNWDSYFDTTDGGSTFNKYNTEEGLTVLESVDDAATTHMGSQYRMPTKDELLELKNNTTQTFIDIDGNEYIKGDDDININYGKLKGVRFTGSNGNSIFIPAVGNCSESMLSGANNGGRLWTSSLYSINDYSANELKFSYAGNVTAAGVSRYYGQSVRGVHA